MQAYTISAGQGWWVPSRFTLFALVTLVSISSKGPPVNAYIGLTLIF